MPMSCYSIQRTMQKGVEMHFRHTAVVPNFNCAFKMHAKIAFCKTYKSLARNLNQHQFFHRIRQNNLYLFTMFRLAVVSALVASATAAPAGPPAPYHPAPAPYHPAPVHPAPVYGKGPAYDESPKPYAYEYGVADDYSGSKFNAAETSDAKVTSGTYSVALPDGRLQTVTYTADPYGYNGYVADVKYSGEPHYAPHKVAPHPALPHPALIPHPAPVHPIHG